jgi:hypothetical protein
MWLKWWQLSEKSWHSRACTPNILLEAATITLPCHEQRSQRVRDPARLRRMVEVACRRLTITPEES